MINVALIGVGPHAKRIYLNYLKKNKINLCLVVEIDSKKISTRTYLDEQGFKNTKIYTINDKYKDDKHMPSINDNELKTICKLFEITHIIISTEPKAHYMYLEFALKNNINVLTDKPITVNKNMTTLKSINNVRREYYELLDLANNSKATCKVMCQRQYHRGYEKIKELLNEIVTEYHMPITNIEIFHSDGAWEFPHDLDKENHPYKYGYGKLYHSGYHFIDLLSDLIKINDSLGRDKKIVKGDVFSRVFTPSDEMNLFNIEDYQELFKDQQLPSYYKKNPNPQFNKYGEKDYHGLLTFYNKKGYTITNATMNLLHNSISRRTWANTKDFYKNNGRIRHERVNIEVGHLLNVQIHSYQSKEIKERTENEETVGGLEHFDIYIFSNPITKRKPFQEIHLKDLYTAKEKKDFLGYNELARETFLKEFLNNKDCKGDIKDQALAIEILYACSKGLHNHYAKKNKIESIEIRNQYTYPYMAKRLRTYSNPVDRNLEKEDIRSNIHIKDIYTIYNFIKYVPDIKKYEVFISLYDGKDVAGSLLDKTFKSKFIAILYYKVLEYRIEKMSINELTNRIEKSASKIKRNKMSTNIE